MFGNLFKGLRSNKPINSIHASSQVQQQQEILRQLQMTAQQQSKTVQRSSNQVDDQMAHLFEKNKNLLNRR